MMQDKLNNVTNRVIFNTFVLYMKLIFSVLLGLITTRIVLDALGETDYGIYILVAGIVGMLNILNSNMSNTSMRYLAYSLGSGEKSKLLKTFNTTLFLHFAIGTGVVILMQIGGWFMFQYLLNIPTEKIGDAHLVFHFMVITAFITVISVPYDALINAHENILILSLVDLFGYVLRLGLAFFLLYSDGNLLVLYGLFLLIIELILRLIKQIYSRLNYDECKIQMRKYTDKTLMKEILIFTSWNLLGSIGALMVTQIRSIIINVFFGVKINTAEGISNTVSAQVNLVSLSMTNALTPQLIKSEGTGDRQRMLRITELSSKFSTFLFALVAIPVILETNYLLNIWLIEVPHYSVIFLRLLLIALLIEKFTFQINHAIKAVGQIKMFQILETFILILNIPLAYTFLKLNFEPFVIYLIGIFISCLLFFNRLYFGKKVAGLDVKKYTKNAIVKVLLPLLFVLFFTLFIKSLINEGFFRFITVIVVFVVGFVASFWLYGISKDEKAKIQPTLINLLKVFNFKRK